MEIDEAETLANLIDMHCIDLLRSVRTEKQSVAWMKIAFNLLEKCSKDLRRPRVFAVHNGFGCATYTLERPSHGIPKKAPDGFFDPHPVWVGGVTVPYGDKYQDRLHIPWTVKDGRRLALEQERQKKMTTLGRPKGKT